MHTFRLTFLAALACAAPGAAFAQAFGAQFGIAQASCDFDADGFADSAVGANEWFDGTVPAGRVYVHYGSVDGLLGRTLRTQAFDLRSLGLGYPAQSYAWYGVAMAGGDFNTDGYCDLAVSASSQSIGSAAVTGLLTVVYGSPRGLVLEHTRAEGAAPPPQAITQADLGDDTGANDLFGAAMAAGDFDGDGFTDLAVSAAGETVGSVPLAGVVHVIFGSPKGLQTVRPAAETHTQRTLDGPDEVEERDRFGSTLAAADFDRDGYCDLAAGAPAESDPEGMGRITLLYGHPDGLGTEAARSRQIDENTIGGPSSRGIHGFAWALAAGDFDDDGFPDLAIGSPTDRDPDQDIVGRVHVLFGSANGLSTARFQVFGQDTPGIADEAEAWDYFGAALAAGDFDADGIDDLAVTATGEEPSGAPAAEGLVHFLPGSPAGLTAEGSLAVAGYPSPHTASEFGFSIATGDFDGDGRTDACVGSPLAKGRRAFGVGTAMVVSFPGRGVRTERLTPW